MELSRRTIQRMILRKSGDTTVINQGSEGGGGGGGSVALGPLLTSLNAEAMPSAEGYIHWTGSAWAFDTPTGGDPVDLTPYALKTWVQDNFAYKNDLVNFITKTEADTYYAALSHSHANYLPLSAGPNKALTGSLYFSGNSGINWSGGVGMLACTPESGWTGISSSQWGVGALSAQGVIRSNANDILHYRNGTNYKIWDAYNFTPSDYLPLTGGTVESLTVTNGLDADSITVSSIVNSNTLAEYLDQDASDARYLQLTGGTVSGNVTMVGNSLLFKRTSGGSYDGAIFASTVTPPGYQSAVGCITISGPVNFDNDGAPPMVVGKYLATQEWVQSQYSSLFTQLANYDGALQITIGGTQKSVTIAYASTAGSANTAVNADKLDNHHASDFALASSLGNYLPLTGGTVESLTVTNGLDADSITVSSLVNSDTLAEYLDQDASDARYLQLTGGTVSGNVTMVGNSLLFKRTSGGSYDGAIFASTVTPPGYQSAVGCITIGGPVNFDNDGAPPMVNGKYIATEQWVLNKGYITETNADDRYVSKNGGTVNGNLNVKGTIQAQDSSGNNKVIIYGTTGNIRAEKVYIGGSTSGYEAATHNWVTSQGYQANVIETVKVAGTALTPTNKAVDIPAATSDGVTFGVVAIGTGFTFDEGRLCVDTSTFATRTWADGRYLPLTAGSSKPLTGDLYLSEDLVLNNEKYIYFKNHSGTLCDALSHSYNEDDGIDTLYLGFGFRKSSHSTEIYGNKLTLLTGASAREKLVITSGGNVGIGTNAPDYKLDVSGVIRATEGMMVRNGSSDAIGIDTTGVFFNKAQEGGSPIPASIFAFTWDSDAQNVIVSKNGNMTVTGKLAVGTTAFDGSNAKLQVGGNMFATGSITSKSNAGNVSLGNGNISANNLYISTVVFGNSNNDAAFYVSNGHIWARNSSGTSTMIV